jgi:hypothetical protein
VTREDTGKARPSKQGIARAVGLPVRASTAGDIPAPDARAPRRPSRRVHRAGFGAVHPWLEAGRDLVSLRGDRR